MEKHKIDEFHKAMMYEAIKAQSEGAFELQWNEKRAEFIDKTRVMIDEVIGIIPKKELDCILDDVRTILNQSIMQYYE